MKTKHLLVNTLITMGLIPMRTAVCPGRCLLRTGGIFRSGMWSAERLFGFPISKDIRFFWKVSSAGALRARNNSSKESEDSSQPQAQYNGNSHENKGNPSDPRVNCLKFFLVLHGLHLKNTHAHYGSYDN